MTIPTTQQAAPEPPAQTPEPGALAPVQPARPIASSAGFHPMSTAYAKGGGKPQTAAGVSVTKALLVALAERIKQRPVTQQKRWEAKKAQALANQVKETRTVNQTVTPTRKDPASKGGKDGKPGPESKHQPSPKQATSNAGTKPQPKPVPKGPERSGTNRSDSRKSQESNRKPDALRKPVDRKS